MAIDLHRLERLDDFLHEVPPALAARLAFAVESDRRRGGALPHARILAALRPKLREVEGRVQRVPTPQRLVCEAFEDLLADGPRARKQTGRILRANVAPIWTWLTETLLPDAWRETSDTILAKLAGGGVDFIAGDVAKFQKRAAEAILAICPAPAGDGDAAVAAARALGGRDQLADAYDMARMLEIAPAVLSMQRHLGRPIRTLDEETVAVARSIWGELSLSHPGAAPYLVFLILGRLDKPWEIMRLSGALSRQIDDALISHSDIGLAGELLLADIEAAATKLKTMRVQEIDADAVIGAVEAFSMISTGIVRELGVRRDGGWGKRLMGARVVIADAVERLLSRATREIAVTLPTARRSSFGIRGRRMPDLTRRLDPAKAGRAIMFARIMAGLRPHAVAGAFTSFLGTLESKITRQLERYTEELVEELLNVSPPLRAQAAGYVEHAAALSGHLMGEEAAAIVRRRAAAAIAAWDSETLVA